jgi:hypothetical protein
VVSGEEPVARGIDPAGAQRVMINLSCSSVREAEVGVADPDHQPVGNQ